MSRTRGAKMGVGDVRRGKRRRRLRLERGERGGEAKGRSRRRGRRRRRGRGVKTGKRVSEFEEELRGIEGEEEITGVDLVGVKVIDETREHEKLGGRRFKLVCEEFCIFFGGALRKEREGRR